jgi:hypothetical protein
MTDKKKEVLKPCRYIAGKMVKDPITSGGPKERSITMKKATTNPESVQKAKPKSKEKQPTQKATKGKSKREKEQRSASHAGFHFHNLYQCCQIKWMTRFLLRIDVTYTQTELINGSAFHEGKAEFYLTGSEAKAISKAKREIKSRELEFKDSGEFNKVYERCPILLKHWIDKFGKQDLDRFEFIAVEEEISLKVPGTNFIFTMRPDAVVRERSGDKDNYIMETKTSGFSIKTTEIGVYYGDQSTAYKWGVEAKYKIPIYGIIPDIAYWNKESKLESNIECRRGNIVLRDNTRVAQFIAGVKQLQSEISQKIEAYKSGIDPYMLFQRNTHYCNAFFKPCEYAPICDSNLLRVKRLPPGFKRSSSRIKPKISDFVEDSFSGIC